MEILVGSGLSGLDTKSLSLARAKKWACSTSIPNHYKANILPLNQPEWRRVVENGRVWSESQVVRRVASRVRPPAAVLVPVPPPRPSGRCRSCPTARLRPAEQRVGFGMWRHQLGLEHNFVILLHVESSIKKLQGSVFQAHLS